MFTTFTSPSTPSTQKSTGGCPRCVLRRYPILKMTSRVVCEALAVFHSFKLVVFSFNVTDGAYFFHMYLLGECHFFCFCFSLAISGTCVFIRSAAFPCLFFRVFVRRNKTWNLLEYPFSLAPPLPPPPRYATQTGDHLAHACARVCKAVLVRSSRRERALHAGSPGCVSTLPAMLCRA